MEIKNVFYFQNSLSKLYAILVTSIIEKYWDKLESKINF